MREWLPDTFYKETTSFFLCFRVPHTPATVGGLAALSRFVPASLFIQNFCIFLKIRHCCGVVARVEQDGVASDYVRGNISCRG